MARKKRSARTLAEYELAHRHLAERLSRIGFLWPGSLTRRYLKCGNPRCACRTDPDARHGPYLYWSTKKGGKTVSRKLPPEEAQVLKQWIANRRETKEILDDMMAISQKAYRLALKEEAKKRDPKLRR